MRGKVFLDFEYQKVKLVLISYEDRIYANFFDALDFEVGRWEVLLDIFQLHGFVFPGVSFSLGLFKMRRTLSVFLRVYFGSSVGVYVTGEMGFIWTCILCSFGLTGFA